MRLLIPAAMLVVVTTSLAHAAEISPDWAFYGGDAGGSRYSPLDQIDKANVSQLKPAWELHTGDVSDGSDGRPKSEFEATPIVVAGTMYLSTPFGRVLAVDPETGKTKWSFDPKIDLHRSYSEGLVNRGVTFWSDAEGTNAVACRERIFIATIDARLFALDAADGRPCADFGSGGQVDLKDGIANVTRAGEYEETSAPTIAGDLVIVGSSVADNDRVDSPDGVVRAFDARRGTLRWSWHPLGGNIAPTGAGNVWSTMSVDTKRGLVFLPTGSASPDYQGAKRPGANTWANSVVALSAQTGKLAWGFQLVHHDLWDYDTAAQPVLAMLDRAGVETPVVIQGNKTGYLFVLDRDSGKPVFDVKEMPVPKSDADLEDASPTQPVPVSPPPLAAQKLTANDAWGLNDNERDACRARLAKLRADGIFTPPSVQGTLAFPGNLGGMNWSSGAFDPKRQMFIANINNLPMEVHLIPRKQYQTNEDAAKRGTLRAEVSPQHGTPYGMSRDIIHSPLGLPCNPPPWGELVAVDLSKGDIKWRVPLGTTIDMVRDPAHVIAGTPNLGGPIVTAGGLTFVASAMDNYLRAFDTDTGQELWKGRLPAGGQAMPMTYMAGKDHKQFVVIAAGGHGKLGTTLGDSVIAYSLP